MVERRALAIGVLAAVVATSAATAWAQAPAGPGRGGADGRGGRGAPFTPAVGDKDLKSVLFNWTWHMGMLRSGNESELVKTLEYEADGGTIQLNGQSCAIKKYRVSANYQIPG